MLRTVWTVHKNNDDRSDGPVTNVCSTKGLANDLAKGSGWYGGNAGVNERKAVQSGDDWYLVDDAHPEPIDIDGEIAAKEAEELDAALAKLTDRERALILSLKRR